MLNYHGLDIPFTSFGNVTSDDLFCEKEQEIFRFYREPANKDRYQFAVDIGANIGVHSLLMARNWNVLAFEPDPMHYELLVRNVMRSGLWIDTVKAAVSDHDGKETFVRVKGNTTGSHIKGDKQPYGELEEFQVEVIDCRSLWEWADFVKIDCEGHEAKILVTAPKDGKTEFMVEVGSEANAKAIWDHLFPSEYIFYSQKRDWRVCHWFEDLPKHHSEGGLFIGRWPPFPY